MRQAARNLGFPPESWQPREAFHGRVGGRGAAALDDLRRGFAVWRRREAAVDTPILARRVREVRDGLARLDRELTEAEEGVGRPAKGVLDA